MKKTQTSNLHCTSKGTYGAGILFLTFKEEKRRHLDRSVSRERKSRLSIPERFSVPWLVFRLPWFALDSLLPGKKYLEKEKESAMTKEEPFYCV